MSISLAPTLLSGMTFRWQRSTAGTFIGVLDEQVVELCEDATGVTFRCSGDATAAEQLLRAHLRLDNKSFCAYHNSAWSEGAISKEQRGLAEFRVAAANLPGVRVVQILSLLECVVSFLGSANNNIKRNMQMIESLCSTFPENLVATDAYGAPRYRFPSCEQLASLSEEALWELGWGYRAPRLFKCSRELLALGGAAHLDALGAKAEAEARASLCALTGIGRKVADCVLLFGYAFDGCVPVDTHCFQLAQRFLLPSHALRGRSLTASVYEAIVAQWHATFGAERAGHAFMALFVPELSDFRKAILGKAKAVAEAKAAVEVRAADAAACTPRCSRSKRQLTEEVAADAPAAEPGTEAKPTQRRQRPSTRAMALSPYFARS